MMEPNSGVANKGIERILELSADAHIRRRGTVKGSPEFHNITGAIAAHGKVLALLTALQHREAQRDKLREQPQIIAAATRQILREHASCQQRHKVPFPVVDRLYRVLRWTKPGSLPWLLLSLLVCTPIVRAQVAGFDKQAVEILGTVFADVGNRPINGAIVNIRSATGGPFVSILTDWSGRFQARGLDPGMYEIVVEEPSYEPTRVTLQPLRGPSPPLELHLRASNSSPVRRTDYAVSVRELRIPAKARQAFEKGLQRLAKNDAAGSRTQFLQATTTFPDYYEAYYHIGVAEFRLGREEEAAQAFQKAIDLSGGHYAWAQFALGLLLCRRGEYADAETVIRQGLDQDGGSATGHLFLSLALFRLNRLEEAEKSAQEALLRKPAFALPYLVLADVHGRRGEYARQLQNLDAYLKLEPKPANKQVREFREVVQGIVFKTKVQE
jgi:tetratricopeptide (TPR) repeat protein